MNKDQQTGRVRSAFASMCGAYVSVAKPVADTAVSDPRRGAVAAPSKRSAS